MTQDVACIEMQEWEGINSFAKCTLPGKTFCYSAQCGNVTPRCTKKYCVDLITYKYRSLALQNYYSVTLESLFKSSKNAAKTQISS